MFRPSLTNRHLDIRLRLKLFDAVESPTTLYGLATAPLTAAVLERLAVAQRKMLYTPYGGLRQKSRGQLGRHAQKSVNSHCQRVAEIPSQALEGGAFNP